MIHLIPDKNAQRVSLVRHIQRRTLIIYLWCVVFGGMLAEYSRDPWWRILGLGVMFPAGGFLMHGIESFTTYMMHGFAFFGGLMLFGLSCVLWFATGNVLAPPMMWLVLAVLASIMGSQHPQHSDAALFVAVVSITTIITAYGWNKITQSRQNKKRIQLNAWLSTDASTLALSFSQEQQQPELTYEEVQRLRFVLDRALQPIDHFHGFEWLDQFQTAAVRYQINFLGYALAMNQQVYMPACGAYMHEAGRNLIHKLRDVRIWRYWTLEHVWGNLRYNPDPIAHENIMFTGFAALQMAMFHASTGARDFLHEDSFILRYDERRIWKHHLPTLIASMQEKMHASPYAFIACEPNWIYPLCNMIGLSAIRHAQPEWWQKHQARFIESLEHDFMDGQGRIIACRARRIGLAFPMMGGVMPQALPCLFLNALAPDVARRQWLLVRKNIMQDGMLNRKAFWRIDTGNYRFSRAAAYSCVALAAREMGDDFIYTACMHALEEECPSVEQGGVRHRNYASVWAHGVEMFARATHHQSFATMMQQSSDMPSHHPMVDHISYAEASVASAHSTPDRLDMVLYPHHHARTTSMTIARLIPHAAYRVEHGGEVQHLCADRDGKIALPVILDGRTAINVYAV
ncbi:MAG: hypothetical protein EAY65_07065 [Alphaproteobacteria bacterium]|nr:MAG: hypothetical protein EAY65_07065 [Alphaproteobacteria bacterium]